MEYSFRIGLLPLLYAQATHYQLLNLIVQLVLVRNVFYSEIYSL